MDRYRKILGVGVNATEAEIRLAYRKKAMRMHPDRNKAANAHERFVELGEAYEYLLALRQGKIRPPKVEQKGKDTSSGRAYDDWVRRESAAARERAKTKAKEDYERYKNSGEFKLLLLLDVLVNLFGLLLAGVVVSLPIAGAFYAILGTPGIPLGLAAATYLVYRLLKHYYPGLRMNPIPHLGNLRYLFALGAGQTVFLSFLNFWVFIKFPLNTLGNHYLLTALLLIPVILILTLLRGRKQRIYTLLYPALFNLFFVVNTVQLKNKRVVTHKIDFAEFQINPTTLVPLKDEVLWESFGIRFEGNVNKIQLSDKMEFHFAEGLFGIEVLEKHEMLSRF